MLSPFLTSPWNSGSPLSNDFQQVPMAPSIPYIPYPWILLPPPHLSSGKHPTNHGMHPIQGG